MSSAKADCEELMNAFVPFAERLLAERGEFYPFGGAMTPSGEMDSIMGYDGRERPPSDDLIRLIKDAFIENAKTGRYKATALVYDVRATKPDSDELTDAIAVSLNHRDSYSVIVLIPYTLQAGRPVFGEIYAQRGESDIF